MNKRLLYNCPTCGPGQHVRIVMTNITEYRELIVKTGGYINDKFDEISYNNSRHHYECKNCNKPIEGIFTDEDVLELLLQQQKPIEIPSIDELLKG